MKTVVVEGTAIRVSRFAFGTASLHHIFSSRQRQRVLGAAASIGMSHFDTSPYYGFGMAEADLGRLLSQRRQGFTVTTKVGLYPRRVTQKSAAGVLGLKLVGKVVPSLSKPIVDWHIARASESLRDSLLRLKTDYVDFLFLHEPEFTLIDTDEFQRWVERQSDAGVIRSWGVAGVSQAVEPFVRSAHPLARVIQTQDSLDSREADFLFLHGRRLQFTYGYLSSAKMSPHKDSVRRGLEGALKRNATGSIIVSTRRAERLESLAKVLD